MHPKKAIFHPALLIELKTKQFIITTNAFAPQLPARGQVIVTQPTGGLPLKGTFHFDEGFYYWRNVGNRILLGGARNQDFTTENTLQERTPPTIRQALETFLSHHIHLPEDSLKIEYCWAGIMGLTPNKQPLIHQPAPNVLAAIACNGMGVALAPVMAEKITAQILG